MERFDIRMSADSDSYEKVTCDNGEYVKFKDIESELDRLKQENESLNEKATIQQDTIDELNSQIVGLGLDVEQLKHNQAKLIEALKPFALIGSRIVTHNGIPYVSSMRTCECDDFLKASQTLKEICGGSNKE